MAQPNPNGANGSTSDPREQVCWDYYIEELAKGIENAQSAALKAGYSYDHARNITLQGWFKGRIDKLSRKELLSDAEKVLKKTLNYKTEKVNGEVKVDLLRVQADVAKHITKTLGKDEGYSNRTELVGKGGGAIETKVTITQVEFDDIITKYADRRTKEDSDTTTSI